MARISLFIFSILLSSCSNPAKESTTETLISRDSSSSKMLASEMDTFYLGNQLVTIEPGSENDFNKLPSLPVDTSEREFLLRDSSLVKRSGDELFLASNKKGSVILKNDNGEENFTDYRYAGYNKDLNQYLIFASYYESFNYILVDRQTGDTTVTCSRPLISPGKKTFICVNSDLQAQFTFNGFELYSNTSKPQRLSSRELTKWGPEEAKWFDDKTLLVKSNIADTVNGGADRIEYFKLTFSAK